MTISHYALAFLSLHHIWSNMIELSDEYVKSLAKAGVEAINRKIKKWNAKLIFSTAYLDPKMRLQLYSMIEITEYTSKQKVIKFKIK